MGLKFFLIDQPKITKNTIKAVLCNLDRTFMMALCQAQEKNRVCGIPQTLFFFYHGRIRGPMNELVFVVRSTAKGQLISKCLFGIFNSSITNEKIRPITTKLPHVDLFSFVFWNHWRHQKDISKWTDLYLNLLTQLISIHFLVL